MPQYEAITLRNLPWYQPNYQPVNESYVLDGVAPHGGTTRWTYTVPTNKIAIVYCAYLSMTRQTAPVASGSAVNLMRIENPPGSPLSYIASLEENTITVGVQKAVTLGTSSIMKAGDNLIGRTADASNGGTYGFKVSANIIEFDA